ncbi:Cullin binding-domain-containing protein [Irpex rosettiformis]|uniref:Cullin binding-domain-containing protein n=1 Tax=Irpex rosettiformis TaxID=378272 RepID=A0ACB8TVW7_9APHY|nr:Cullin binding-domain-containing protein [Irpex rosettiformis]
MAPKRKRAAADAATPPTTTRATRSSTRVVVSSLSSTTSAINEGVPAEDPKPKRSRKTIARSTKATAATLTTPESTSLTTRAEGGSSSGNSANTSIGSSTKHQKVIIPPKSISATESEPYSAATANILFARYADEDDPEVIGPGGLERLCGDADIPLEGALPLILAWQFGASEMAKVKKNEWEKGTSMLQISSLPSLATALHDLEDFLILNKPALKPPVAAQAQKKKSLEPYNRAKYYQYAQNKSKAFNEFYLFCFMLVKPPQGRNIEMETASAFWTVLLVPRYELMQQILDFIAEKGSYKGVNKDLWQMVLEFCQTVSPTLENFEADGAWPTMLDEFVAWKKDN